MQDHIRAHDHDPARDLGNENERENLRKNVREDLVVVVAGRIHLHRNAIIITSINPTEDEN